MRFQYFYHAIIGITAAEMITLPIYTIKTNYQNIYGKSIRSVFFQIYQRGGIMEFYRASPFALGSQIISTGIKYPIYKYLNESPRFVPNLLGTYGEFACSNKFINGIASGIIGSVVVHPIDVIKIYWQMGTSFGPDFKKIGPGLFYRGYSKTLGKNIASGASFIPIYEYMNEYWQNTFVASSFSATISTFIVYPLDYLKTRHIYGQSLFQGWNPLV